MKRMTSCKYRNQDTHGLLPLLCLLFVMSFLSINFLPNDILKGEVEITEQIENAEESNGLEEVTEKSNLDDYIHLIFVNNHSVKVQSIAVSNHYLLCKTKSADIPTPPPKQTLFPQS